MAVKPVISVSKKATKLMLYVYLCECGGGPGHSGTKPKGKRREERRRGEERIVNGYEKDAQYNFELQFSESSFP